MSQTTLAKGEIDYVNSSSGCGFIVAGNIEEDVLFFPDAAVGFTPEAGQEVTFEIVQTNDGPRALELHRV